MLPWLDTPVLLHSSRMNMCKLTPAQCEYKSGHWRSWYVADWVYGHATLYFMCAIIGVFAIPHVLTRIWRAMKRASPLKSNKIWQRALASTRFLGYRTFYLRGLNWYSPAAGVMLLGLAGFVYFMSLTLGPKPYYWPKKPSYGDSPPIATRSGWMALALLPFVMILSSKVNWITVLTGVSHEKLQVFHRWASWTMFVLALVHTFPFIVVHMQKHDMMLQWRTSVVYWTGVAALIPQAWLNIMSIGPIRNRFYESFKATHFIAIIFFIFFLFIHCDFTLSSWDYFIATLALYLPTLVYGVARTVTHTNPPHAASLTLLQDGTLQITIPSPIIWSPGQHVFLRFWSLGIHTLSTHPFTICSLPDSRRMEFYVKPAGGFTARMAKLAGTQERIPVSIDGPYGDSLTAQKLSEKDAVVLIAGGSGAGYLLPLLETLVREPRTGGNDVKVIIAIRHRQSVDWLFNAMEGILSFQKESNNTKVSVSLQITDDTPLPTPQGSIQDTASSSLDAIQAPPSDLEKNNAASTETTAYPAKFSSRNGVAVAVIEGRGRPDLKALIQASTTEGRSVGIAACGPVGMMLDVRNACAEAQRSIIAGERGGEVWLHTESFSW
ncbi:Ferric/cupric reductase transmembrane component [Lachnellula subtilissima]|uniref:ferric-chelate reductase (NADPH) n=1 Tax=Lachnellula subtilissima TaxID=602034 RepID=A0A8H8RD54_9HELO|nr:Ferric/cupric reductase transmembrane component [Lachnellula subtilissima]